MLKRDSSCVPQFGCFLSTVAALLSKLSLLVAEGGDGHEHHPSAMRLLTFIAGFFSKVCGVWLAFDSFGNLTV